MAAPKRRLLMAETSSRRSFLTRLLSGAAGTWVAVAAGINLLAGRAHAEEADECGDEPPVDKYGGPPPKKTPPKKKGGTAKKYGGPPKKYGGPPPAEKYGGPPPDATKYGGPQPPKYGGPPKATKYGGPDR